MELKTLFQAFWMCIKNILIIYGNIANCIESFIKAESDWYNASMDLRKAKDNYNTEKMDKLEKGMVKLKGEVEKFFTEKNHRSEFVTKSMVRVDQCYQKLKTNMKNVAW